MSEGIIIALIGLLGTLLGAAVGAFATIRVAQMKGSSEDQTNKSGSWISCSVVGLISSMAAIVGLVLGVLFAIYALRFFTPSPLAIDSPIPTPFPTNTVDLTPISSEVTYTIILSADAIWYDTKIEVMAGQLVEMVATGNAATLTGDQANASNTSDPNGQTTICPNSRHSDLVQLGCLMNNVPYGALVGKISDNAPFLVGSVYSDSAPVSGTIYLAVNDHEPYYEDNQGTYRVSITIK